MAAQTHFTKCPTKVQAVRTPAVVHETLAEITEKFQEHFSVKQAKGRVVALAIEHLANNLDEGFNAWPLIERQILAKNGVEICD